MDEKFVAMNWTHFPLLIEYTDKKEKKIVRTPADIESGRGFVVLECRTRRRKV